MPTASENTLYILTCDLTATANIEPSIPYDPLLIEPNTLLVLSRTTTMRAEIRLRWFGHIFCRSVEAEVKSDGYVDDSING